ncbi:MAG: thymidine phosphorylase [Acidobacteriota bacterium]|nr:thymidine phosphorylase [Acidobacteriota bacterium]
MSEPANTSPYDILRRKRAGESLNEGEIAAVIAGAASGAWDDSQLGAFLMAGAIQGLDTRETRDLTREMLLSGEQWRVSESVPGTIDKHSTGGVGDKISMLVAPMLAACGAKLAKLTAPGLGHTGGTADKLASLPGLQLEMDRSRCLELLDSCGIAIGVPTAAIAPADRRIYALRDVTATVDCLAYVVSSILSKKLALGADVLVFDVKIGSGSFFPSTDSARELATLLVEVAAELGQRAVAVITDMSQPLGSWAGHNCEVREVLDCLATGKGDERLLEVALGIAEVALEAGGSTAGRSELVAALTDGSARRCLLEWAEAQGVDRQWLEEPDLPLAPYEVVIEAPSGGVLAAVATRELGLALVEAGGGRRHADDDIARGTSLWYRCRLGDRVERGQELGRIYLPEGREFDGSDLSSHFVIADEATVPPAIHGVVG